MSKYKVDITGINTSELKALSNEEQIELVHIYTWGWTKNLEIDKEIILIQQSQTIAIFDELDENAIGALLLATKEKGNEDLVYNFLYPNETLAFDFSKSYKILKYLCLHGINDVNWNILDEYRNQRCPSDIGSIIVV